MSVITPGRIEYSRRLNNSYYGNPRFAVTFEDGTTALTSSDAAVSYDVENCQHVGNPVVVELTRAGRITYMWRDYGHRVGDTVKSSDLPTFGRVGTVEKLGRSLTVRLHLTGQTVKVSPDTAINYSLRLRNAGSDALALV